VREHKLAAALLIFALACSSAIRAEDRPIEEQLVDAMNKVFVSDGARADRSSGCGRSGETYPELSDGRAARASEAGAAIFHLKAQLAAAGDSTKDATKAWPQDRKVVDLGLLTVNKAVANSAEVEKTLLFLPGQLTDGIEQSDDPLIDVRSAAYAISFARRSQ
jgi:hypothetical protein